MQMKGFTQSNLLLSFQLKTTNRDPRVDRYEINDRSIVFYLRKVGKFISLFDIAKLASSRF